MSKSIRKLLLIAMCSLSPMSLMAEPNVVTVIPPSMSECEFLKSKLVVPEACSVITITATAYATYSPPQPFLNTELQTYKADQAAQSSILTAPVTQETTSPPWTINNEGLLQ